jgi:hypothetical protein
VGFLDRTTAIILTTACALAVVCVLPPLHAWAPLGIVAMGLRVANPLFHELGHSIFAWLYGVPNLPSILTLFGSDQAGGVTVMMDRSWIMQGIALLLLPLACWRLRDVGMEWFYAACALTAFIAFTAFTPFYRAVITYMGHGGAMAVGGYLLYRALVYLDARNQFERWLNALFGFYLLLYNVHFSWRLMTDAYFRSEYQGSGVGASHHDFYEITFHIHAFTVDGVAIFTIAAGAAIIGLAFAAAWYTEHYGDHQ